MPPRLHAAEQDRPDVAERRARWVLERLGLDPRGLIFIDETCAKSNMTRLRGRAPVGERLAAQVPHGHWNTTTQIGALGLEGVRCSTLVDGPVNTEVFVAFVEQMLCPALRPGDLVVMDNLPSHKGVHVRELIESRGAAGIYLPPYSPDFNPIEMIFAKIKQALRSPGGRTRDAL